MKLVRNINNHFNDGGKHTHPLFDGKYFAENIASLIETTILFIEVSLISVFSFSLTGLMTKIDNLPFAMIGDYARRVLVYFAFEYSAASCLVVLIISIFLFFFTRRYFNWVKYNLHPQD